MTQEINYISQPWQSTAFQFCDASAPVETYPRWFQELIEMGKVAVYVDRKGRREPYMLLDTHRRTLGCIAELGDYIVRDEFGYLHVVSKSTFHKRYTVKD